MEEIKKFDFKVEYTGGIIRVTPGSGDQGLEDHVDATIHLLGAIIRYKCAKDPLGGAAFVTEQINQILINNMSSHLDGYDLYGNAF